MDAIALRSVLDKIAVPAQQSGIIGMALRPPDPALHVEETFRLCGTQVILDVAAKRMPFDLTLDGLDLVFPAHDAGTVAILTPDGVGPLVGEQSCEGGLAASVGSSQHTEFGRGPSQMVFEKVEAAWSALLCLRSRPFR